MDGFDKKREMVKMLMEMLKHNAASEVSGTGNASGHPHMADLTKTNTIQQRTSDSSKMADGGMALASDEPMREMPKDLPSEDVSNPALENLPGPVEDEEKELEELQNIHNFNLMDEDEDNNSSSFQAFLKRKK